jgi:hypothetical protein
MIVVTSQCITFERFPDVIIQRFCSDGCVMDWTKIVYNLHPLFETDEVSEESWQLITAIHDEGDCLTLCE